MIDPSSLTATDFIGVRASLIRALGGDAGRAIVVSRIYWRTSTLWKDSHEDSGSVWWRTTYAVLAEETGLSADQVRRAVKWLVEQGHVETHEFRFNGITDRTLSFRVITSMAESPDGVAESPVDVADSPPQSMADSPSLLSLKKVRRSEPASSGFDDFWAVYPRRLAKQVATKSWERAIKTADPADIIAAAERFSHTVANSEERFIPHPSTWLNQSRWEDFPPEAPKLTIAEKQEQQQREFEEARERAERMSREATPSWTLEPPTEPVAPTTRRREFDPWN